jgi:hypothetical protein
MLHTFNDLFYMGLSGDAERNQGHDREQSTGTWAVAYVDGDQKTALKRTLGKPCLRLDTIS